MRDSDHPLTHWPLGDLDAILKKCNFCNVDLVPCRHMASPDHNELTLNLHQLGAKPFGFTCVQSYPDLCDLPDNLLEDINGDFWHAADHLLEMFGCEQ